ncbi:hypothetical protein [Pelagibius sp.]|uniref:hypothetical protein n=1 Tax=Pelagibius sp. TaxID=1931238 RepID=UPI002636B599|nr:hypothetical protein [Pelagibius sp.]
MTPKRLALRLGGWRRRAVLIPAVLSLAGLTACDSTTDTIALTAGIAVGTTVVGANIPGQEIEQIYYLGVFDPQEQVPPTIYRVRVHGQASVYSSVKFASGWVPAQVIDSLSSHVGFAVNDPSKPGVQIEPGKPNDIAKLTPGRRLIQFGPEGFRESPKDHRLVIVMGGSPEAFFQAIDEALGSVGGAIQARQDADLKGELFKALVLLRAQRDRLDDLSREVDTVLLLEDQARAAEAQETEKKDNGESATDTTDGSEDEEGDG